MNDWIELVSDEAANRLAQGRIFLLSQVPDFIRRNEIDPSGVLSGRPLKVAIAVDGKEKLELVRDPDDELVWGVIPKSETPNANLNTLFQKIHKTAAPRFKSWFWAAFVKKVDPGERRFLLDDRFTDIPAGETGPVGGIAIEPDYIAGVEQGVLADPEVVLTSIDAWAKGNDMSLEVYHLDLHDLRSRKGSAHKAVPNFDSLEEDDLKRIMVPLDIVTKLMRR